MGICNLPSSKLFVVDENFSKTCVRHFTNVGHSLIKRGEFLGERQKRASMLAQW